MFVQTNIHYYKITNSKKQFCGLSNRASIAKLLTRYRIHLIIILLLNISMNIQLHVTIILMTLYYIKYIMK